MSRIYPPSKPWLKNKFFTALLALPFLVASPCHGYQTGPKTATDKLLKYLDDNGLSRLAIRHTEEKLARELDSRRRDQIAVNLAGRYQRFFFTNIAEGSADEFIQQADWLSKSYPAINTPSFKLAISHANYVQTERRFRKWWQSSATHDGRESIASQLRKLEREIAAQIRTGESRQQQLISEMAVDPLTQMANKPLVDQIEVQLLHSHYLFAWTNYFLAVLPNESSKPMLRQAQSSFYRALRIEQSDPIEKIDLKWLDFSAPISGRALLGLAATYTALKRPASARFCFDHAESLGVAVRQRAILEFNALAYAKHWELAVEYAQKQSVNITTVDRAEFWAAVTHAGYAQKDESEQARKLRQAGLLGLAREFAFDKLRHFAITEEIDFAPDSTEKKWIQALVQYHISELSNTEPDSARNEINQLIESSSNNPDNPDIAKMRCLAALMEFKSGNFEKAHEQIQNIQLEHVKGDQSFAQRLDWLNVLVQLRRASAESVNNANALNTINQFIDRHPDSNSYQRAIFERFKLANNLLPSAQALHRLKELGPDHPFFNDVQFAIVNCLRRCWAEAERDGATQEKVFEQLVLAEQSFRGLPDIQAARKLSAILVVVDVAMRIPKEKSFIKSLIGTAETIELQDKTNAGLHSALDFFKFRYSKQFDELPTAADLAQHLCKASAEKSHRIASLAFIARLFDQNVEAIELKMNAMETYELLVQELGTSEEILSRSKNARVAATRLVELYIAAPEFTQEAQTLNEKLLKLAPNRLDLLLNSARISMSLDELETALNIWRKIGRSVKAGDDAWFEAKLGSIRCLMGSDPKSAAKVLRQTKTLVGEIPESWRHKFDEAKEQLQATAHRSGEANGAAKKN